MRKRILVLDDHQDMLDVVQEALTYEKFQVRVTSDSSHIIDIANEYHPDLFIMDYKLIGSQGGDICRLSKANPQLENTPVIICSAYVNQHNDLSSCGCDAVIAKPFGLEELLEKVNDFF